MERKVCLITGASGGIGLATARALGRQGFRVRITGRDPDKLERARAALAAEGLDVEALRADFSSLEEVRALAAELLARGEPLHALVNNAGVWHATFQRSRDGWEDTFAVNHLAPFLLTNLLLPRLRETARAGEARVVHVSSRLHLQAGQTSTVLGRLVHAANVLGLPVRAGAASLDLAALDREEGYRGLEAYARSKLAQVIFSCELARREPDVTSNAVHPGSVQTDVTRESALLRAVAPLARLVLLTPEEGAEPSVYVASAPALRGVSGRYFARSRRLGGQERCREAQPATVSGSGSLAAALWDLSAARVGLAAAGA